MTALSILVTWVAGLLMSWYLLRMAGIRLAYRRAMLENGCSTPKKYPHKEPFLGLDMFLVFAKAMQSGQLLPKVESLFTEYGKTFVSNAWGRTVLNTMDSQVIQSILTVESKKFGVAPDRTEALAPLMKDGIFTADGEAWTKSRALAKQIFSGVRQTTIPALEPHVNHLLNLIPRDGSTVDLQPLLKRMVSLPAPRG